MTDLAGGWRTAAACAGLGPSLFYDPSPAAVARAVAICASCRARTSCHAEAVEGGEFGVWGGTTEEARRPVSPPPRLPPGPPATLTDAELASLLACGAVSERAVEVLRRHADIGRRTAYKYLARAQVLGLVERRGAFLYPTRR